jgi:site-specific recombinase XerD
MQQKDAATDRWWERAEPADAPSPRPEQRGEPHLPALRRPEAGNPRMDLAIAAWLHAKFQRSGSAKTRTAYAATLGGFRAALAMEGLDLDSADPRRCRADVDGNLAMGAVSPTPDERALASDQASAVEDRAAARAAAIALVAQAYAARPAESRYGPRPVAAATANLRLAALSSFYAYATRQDLLRGPNPIARVERRRVEAYAAARPLAYDDLRERLAAIDVASDAGLRDYALLLLGLHTGRRVAELAGMHCEHLLIRKRAVEIVWPRCKGGRTMRDELPRGGARGEAADALVAWVTRLYGNAGERGGGSVGPKDNHLGIAVVPIAPAQPGRPPERPIWVSLARNGTAGHPLTARAIAQLCEKRLGTSKVHTLRHTFARALEDAGAKVSEIQAALGHADLGTTGRYLARLRHGENRHLARLSSLYGLGGLDRRTGTAIGVDTQSSAPPPQLDSADAGDTADATDATDDATEGEADWA